MRQICNTKKTTNQISRSASQTEKKFNIICKTILQNIANTLSNIARFIKIYLVSFPLSRLRARDSGGTNHRDKELRHVNPRSRLQKIVALLNISLQNRITKLTLSVLPAVAIPSLSALNPLHIFHTLHVP